MPIPKETPHVALLGGIWALALIRAPALPEALPIHWNLDLVPDATGPRAVAVFLLPAIATLVWATLRFAPMLLGGRPEIEASEPAYSRLRLVTLAFLAGLSVLLHLLYAEVISALAPGLPLLLGLLLIGLGLTLPSLRPNRFAGVRVPATLRDPEVWVRTHRLAGRLFGGAGAVTAGAAFFSGRAAMLSVLVGTLVAAVWSVVYAGVLGRRRR